MTNPGRKAAKNAVAAKKRAPAAKRRTSAAPSDEFEVGDIVMFTSADGVVGPGRLCARIGFGQACVMFGAGVGCRRVPRQRLSLAPAGSTAPPCDGCDDC